MKIKAYSIRDSILSSFALPFYAQNHAHAKRICKEVIQHGDTSISLNPADFELFHIGSFEDASGTIAPLVNIEAISRLDQLVDDSL